MRTEKFSIYHLSYKSWIEAEGNRHSFLEALIVSGHCACYYSFLWLFIGRIMIVINKLVKVLHTSNINLSWFDMLLRGFFLTGSSSFSEMVTGIGQITGSDVGGGTSPTDPITPHWPRRKIDTTAHAWIQMPIFRWMPTLTLAVHRCRTPLNYSHGHCRHETYTMWAVTWWTWVVVAVVAVLAVAKPGQSHGHGHGHSFTAWPPVVNNIYSCLEWFTYISPSDFKRFYRLGYLLHTQNERGFVIARVILWWSHDPKRGTNQPNCENHRKSSLIVPRKIVQNK
jgi:hypothetical protein